VTALEPAPTRQDERIYALLPDAGGPGVRAAHISAALAPRYGPPRPSREEVRLTLRGYEHLGHAECRAGWWRRAAPKLAPKLGTPANLS
jgi:hypothetical protein